MENVRIIIFTILLFIIKVLNAQLPLNDPNWTQVLNENFTGPTLNSTKWYDSYIWGRVNNGDEYNDAANLLFISSSGQDYLRIKCETMTPMYWPRAGYISDYLHYRSGAIFSKTKYKYGYWEISAKYPAGYQGYWPAFWLWDVPGIIPGCPSNANNIINEIDVMEIGGQFSVFTDRMGMNYHWRDVNCVYGSLGGGLWPGYENISGTITAEHKYSMFWEPGKITWYFDDVPVMIIDDPANTPTYAMSTIINFAIDPPEWYTPLPSTVFPANLDINYINIYQLNPSAAGCNTVENICVFNAGTYTYEVKKSVSIGGSGCTSSINTTSNVHFWATDFVLLDEGTTITSGGSGNFSANITNCPN